MNSATPSSALRNITEVHDAVIEAEERLDLFSLSAHGHSYWPWIRNAVFHQTQRALGLTANPHASWTERKLREVLTPLTKSPGELVRRLQWKDLSPADALVFNHNRQQRTPAGFMCPYTGPPLATSDVSRWVIQASHNAIMAAPPADERTRYLELPLALHGAASMVSQRHRMRRREIRDLRDALGAFTKALGVSVPFNDVLREARYAVQERQVRRAFYPQLLDRVKPKVVVIVVHYSRRCMPMTELARERGIPVVEVQHGLLGPTHLAYNYAPGRCPDMFPDYLLSFGDFWTRATPGLPLSPERCIPVGFPWLEQQKEAEPPQASKGPPELLFLSQGAIGESLSRLAVAAAKKLRGKWNIRYRLHPGERSGWTERYPWLVEARRTEPNLTIDEAEGSVYGAFARADAQIGVYSTAVYEGLTYGLRTLVADLPGWEGCLPLLERGAAHRVSDVDALAAALESPAPDSALQRELWADDPITRFRSALAHLSEHGVCRP